MRVRATRSPSRCAPTRPSSCGPRCSTRPASSARPTEAVKRSRAWLGGLEIASRTHGAGGWSLPLRQLGRVSLYAFGSVAAVAAYLGIPVLLRSRAPGSLAIVAHLLCGYVLLGRVGFDMMRHLEFVAASTAIAAAAALLMTRRNHDASGYLDLGLDYIATTDFARSRASGPTAPGFFEALFSGQRYRLAAVLGPGPDPLCLPDWLGSQRPGDLLYVRSTFYVFERRS